MSTSVTNRKSTGAHEDPWTGTITAAALAGFLSAAAFIAGFALLSGYSFREGMLTPYSIINNVVTTIALGVLAASVPLPRMFREVIDMTRSHTLPGAGAALAGIAISSVLAIMATLAFAPPAGATFPHGNGLIAFQAETEQGTQIFTIRPNGHQLRQITHVDGAAGLPDWSPDGRRIAFTLNECAIALMDADGDNVQEIAADPDLCLSDASFTPDGARLVYTRFAPALDAEQIWSMKIDGSDQQFITDAGGPDPNVSPDGQKLSFKGAEGALFVANIDGSGIVQVSPSISVAYKHDWSPDGQHLVVSDNSDPAPDEAVNVVTVRPDGRDWTYVTHYPAGYRANTGGYSPDGQWIVFRLTGPGLVPTMYRIRPDGTDLHALYASSTIVPRFIDWGPAARH